MRPGPAAVGKVSPFKELSSQNMPTDNEIIDNIANKEYEFGFVTDIEMDILPAGLNEDTIRYISEKKKEPEWLLEWRLKGYQAFRKQKLPSGRILLFPRLIF